MPVLSKSSRLINWLINRSTSKAGTLFCDYSLRLHFLTLCFGFFGHVTFRWSVMSQWKKKQLRKLKNVFISRFFFAVQKGTSVLVLDCQAWLSLRDLLTLGRPCHLTLDLALRFSPHRVATPEVKRHSVPVTRSMAALALFSCCHCARWR